MLNQSINQSINDFNGIAATGLDTVNMISRYSYTIVKKQPNLYS